jgi:DNA-binding CsgD family transcriptional regulator
MGRRELPGLGEREWNALLADIYDAALRPQTWGQVLLRIGRPLHAHAGQLVVIAKDVSRFYDNIAIGFDLPTAVPQFQQMIERGLHVRANAASRLPEMNTITDHCHTDARQMKRHPFYQEHAFPLDVPYYGGTIISKSADTFVASVVLRSKQYGHLTSNEVRYLNCLGPHIRRSLELSFRLPKEGFIKGVASTMSGMSCGAFIVNRYAEILATNSKADQILARRDGIVDRGKVLGIADKRADELLRNELRGMFCHGASAAVTGTGFVSAQRNPDYNPYGLFAVPLGENTLPFDCQCAVVMVIDPDESLAIPDDLLQHSFNLTPAECSVTTLLVNGQSLRQIANTRSCSIETIRSQLKRIYSKTECTHQSELIKKILATISVRLRTR